MRGQLSAERIDLSQSFAILRYLPSQENHRSTTQRRGVTSKPFALSECLTISIVQHPIFFRLPRSFGPAYPPSANTWRSQGCVRRIDLST